MHQFTTNDMFMYNTAKKRMSGAIVISSICIALTVMLMYMFFWRHSDVLLVKIIEAIFLHIKSKIYDSVTMLGVFYASFFGGLFFLIIPMEALFIRFSSEMDGVIVMLLFIIGFIFSFSINYWIGRKFSEITKKLITPKKFYKLKGVLNRRGGLAVVVINAIPFFPSQPLSAILGVFKYNMTRFYVYVILGQVTKYVIMIVITTYTFGKFKMM